MTEHNRLPEPKLIQQLQNGSVEAFSALYVTYHRQFLLYLIKLVKDRTMAEDLLHDAFLRVWDARNRLDPSLPFKPFLYTIGRNLFLNLIKRSQHETDILQKMKSQAINSLDSTTHLLDYRDSARLIQEAIGKLPPRCQEVYLKCHVEEHTYEEAAQLLGITPSTVRNQMVKALRLIREYVNMHQGLLSLLMIISSSATASI